MKGNDMATRRSPPVSSSAPLGPRTAQEVAYHSSRSIEELDEAAAALDKDARQAHEQLASLHLRIAAGLRSGDLSRIVADRVD
jgi:hypothetical protein